MGDSAIVLTVEVQPSGGEPLALPINCASTRRAAPSNLDLMQAMVEEVAGWLPDYSFLLRCDGAYTSLARRALSRAHRISWMRKGDRLPSLQVIAKANPLTL